ncbi:MAG: hypothetical protein A3G24_23410 [Betaproteobacteria bacterium RIFCSPLOWO2_12_FULL_62_13]|nr:MAG: hypothetical protein A3G24_23410 [Betaproteobacteria bacterium RIFCSPLOWO2_12_FULL_62_13]
MRNLNLDFAARKHAFSWPGMLLLIIAAAVTWWEIFGVYSDAQGEADRLEAQVERLERRTSGAGERAPRLDERTVREIRNANEIIGKITLRWERLFKAVQSAGMPRVGLLGMAPDQKTGNVEISAEAADREAMFDYLGRLERQPALRNVYLLSHQTNVQDPDRPLRFVVTASWIEEQSN